MLPPLTHSPPPPSMTMKEVHNLFKKLNIRKAVNPDCISSSTIKYCDDQLAPIFTDLFNEYLDLCIVPACFKTSTIIPVFKTVKITDFNNYIPVVFTSVLMKSSECLILTCLGGGGHRWSARLLVFCIQGQQFCGWCHQHGSPLQPPTSGYSQGLCNYSVYGFQHCLQNHHSRAARK